MLLVTFHISKFIPTFPLSAICCTMDYSGSWPTVLDLLFMFPLAAPSQPTTTISPTNTPGVPKDPQGSGNDRSQMFMKVVALLLLLLLQLLLVF